MTYRRIIEYPDRSLKNVSVDFDLTKDDDRHVLEDLKDTFNVVAGYGLSAPQIGFSLRVIVINANLLGAGDEAALLMINPKIVQKESSSLFEEACFSMPGLGLKITRAHKVTVEWLSEDGESQSRDFTGYAAACVQHEIDHLDGVLMLDRISQLRKSLILKKIKKADLKKQRSKGASSDEKSKRKAAATRKRLKSLRKKKK